MSLFYSVLLSNPLFAVSFFSLFLLYSTLHKYHLTYRNNVSVWLGNDGSNVATAVARERCCVLQLHELVFVR